jgi:hypothetical protein
MPHGVARCANCSRPNKKASGSPHRPSSRKLPAR